TKLKSEAAELFTKPEIARNYVKRDAHYYRKGEAEQANYRKHKQGTKADKLETDMDAYGQDKKNFSREDLAEYRLAKELRNVNRKRVVRESADVLGALT